MERYDLKRPESFKQKKRVGCGPSSGSGKTCGRGMNGQMSRSGSKKRAWFEGGQMPLQRRVPKRGFNNYTRKVYQTVNLAKLESLGAQEITPDILAEKRIISQRNSLVKVLGSGDITKSLKVVADAFSQTAVEKIKKAGGDAIIREYPLKKNDKTGQ